MNKEIRTTIEHSKKVMQTASEIANKMYSAGECLKLIRFMKSHDGIWGAINEGFDNRAYRLRDLETVVVDQINDLGQSLSGYINIFKSNIAEIELFIEDESTE